MSLFGFDYGVRQSTTPKLLPSSGASTILTAGTDADLDITDIFVANADGSAATILLTIYDGSNTYTLLPTYSIAAHTYLHVTFPFVLPKGWSIKATPGTNNVETIHVSYVKPSK